MSVWRVDQKIPLNVYEGDRLVCQCHAIEDAYRIAAAMNASIEAESLRSFWDCPNCGLLNLNIALSKCRSCGEPRPLQSPVNSDEPDQLPEG